MHDIIPSAHEYIITIHTKTYHTLAGIQVTQIDVLTVPMTTKLLIMKYQQVKSRECDSTTDYSLIDGICTCA